MTKGTQIDDGTGRCPHAVSELPVSSSRSAAGGSLIQFPLRNLPPPRGSAAAGDPPSDPAASNSFVSLGAAVLPVVMRLQKGRPRLKLAPVSTALGDDRDRRE